MNSSHVGTALLVLFALAAVGSGHVAAAGADGPGVATPSDGAASTETSCLVFRRADPDAEPVRVDVNESGVHVSLNRSVEYEVACPRPERR